LTGTPVARFILVEPGVQFKTVKGHPLLAQADFSDIGAYFSVEPVPIHAEIAGGIPKTDHTRQQDEIPA
jgi:hypothetical protein